MSAANPWLEPTRKEPRQGRKAFIYNALFYRPFRALFLSIPYQGFASLTPGYYLVAAPRLKCKKYAALGEDAAGRFNRRTQR